MIDEVAQYDVDAVTAKTIVCSIIEWYEAMRKVRMQIGTQGRRVGRPRSMTPVQSAEARRLHARGLSFREIGERFGVSNTTVWYELLPPEKRAKKMKLIRAGVDRWRAAREPEL